MPLSLEIPAPVRKTILFDFDNKSFSESEESDRKLPCNNLIDYSCY